VSAQKLENVVNTSKSTPAFQEINLILMATYEKKPARLMPPRPAKILASSRTTLKAETITFNFSNLEKLSSLRVRD
jgi:hypothetical protein